MAFRVEIGARADAQLADLEPVIAASIERKIIWLAENAHVMLHRRLVSMPADLEGLCKLRVGDYRILYWAYPARELVRIYRIAHRSEVYRNL
jgi:mRNA interferase RelE/StbE